MTSNQLNQEAIAQKVDELFSEYDAKVHGYLDIAVIGEVSSGKSSFLNAFFDCPKNEPKFPVSARAGVTTAADFKLIGSHIRILDTPGLQDVDKTKVEKTEKILKEGIDIGVLIITGAANEQQLNNYKLLKKTTNHVFVVLNKSDQYTKESLQEIKIQWREVLSLDPNTVIYEVCCRGYDFKDKLKDPITRQEQEIPVDQHGIPKTIIGMQPLKDEIFEVCFKLGKVAFIAKEIKRKQLAAIGIIAAACAASVGAILLPGSIAYILASQATAISSLGYLYKDEFLSKKEVAKIMAIFGTGSAQGIGAVVYGLFVSFLPPTGVFDIPGIILVVSYMATTLLLVNFFFSKGLEIKKSASLEHEFNRISGLLQSSVANADFREVGRMDFWTQLLSSIQINIGASGASDKPLPPKTSRTPVTPSSPANLFSLEVGSRIIPLNQNTQVREGDIPGLTSLSSNRIIAQVNPNPQTPTILGLQNLSHQTWIATKTDGSSNAIEPSRTIKLAVGTKINFGSVEGEIHC